MTTNELAVPLGILPQSIHHRYSTTGSYFGLHPQKLPNRRLIWPADSVERLLAMRQSPSKQEAEHAAS